MSGHELLEWYHLMTRPSSTREFLKNLLTRPAGRVVTGEKTWKKSPLKEFVPRHVGAPLENGSVIGRVLCYGRGSIFRIKLFLNDGGDPYPKIAGMCVFFATYCIYFIFPATPQVCHRVALFSVLKISGFGMVYIWSSREEPQKEPQKHLCRSVPQWLIDWFVD